MGSFAQRGTWTRLVLTLVEDLDGCYERPGLGRGGSEAANKNQYGGQGTAHGLSEKIQGVFFTDTL